MDSLSNIFKFCVRQKKELALLAGTILVPALFVLAQTDAPQATTAPVDTQVSAALEDLSELYGQPVTRVDQARAICNLEKYLTDCAQIGKKHELFDSAEIKQVDAVLGELKGKVVEDLKNCTDETCLLGVANRLATQLVSKNPTLARELEFTKIKIEEKKAIVDTAKKAGVDIQECRSADPDTAPVELLRACAKLAKSQEVQKYLPEEARRTAQIADSSLDLKDALQKGDYQCGDGTLDGCGNFCLNPQAPAAGGTASIPQVCRQIAQRFFGQEGVRELENAYTKVLSTTEYYNKRAESVLFTTVDGKIITDPADIGKYLEAEMKNGNVEAIEKGMDFMVSKGFAKPQDKGFALSMVKKVREQGGTIDFDACAQNPKACRNFVPEEQRKESDAMEEVYRLITQEMKLLGVARPELCETNPALGEQCLKAAKTVLPKIEEIAQKYPDAKFIVNDIKQKISFGDQGLEARRRAEKQFRNEGGRGLAIGDKVFSNFTEMEAYCRENGSFCLAEAARKGFIERDYAAQKYEYTYDVQYGRSDRPGFPGQGPYPGFTPPGQGGFPPGQTTGFTSPGPGFYQPPGFNKDEALKQFQNWLENPQGAPPIPSFGGPGGPYPQPGYPQPGGQYPQYGPYPYPQPGPGGYQQPYCPSVYPKPCPDGQYRQESRDQKGCFVLSECVSVNRSEAVEICPSLPTVDSCPSGQEKRVTYSSPKCGTYYACVTQGSNIPSCSSGQYWDGKTCVNNVNALIDCREGQYWNGSTCVYRDESGQCPPGQYWDGKGCLNSNAKCPVGQYWDGNKCLAGPSDVKFPFFFPAGYTAGNAEAARTYCEMARGAVTWNQEICPKFGVKAECSDGRDNDGDGKIDYPADPDCFNPEGDEARFEVIKPSIQPYPYSSPYPYPTTFPAPVTYPYTFPGTGYIATSDAALGTYCGGQAPGSGPPGTTLYAQAQAECVRLGKPWGGSTYPTYPSPSGQKEQIWNSLGLRSWIRADADVTRIANLKSVCANVASGANIWMPEAGNYGSPDFGMPDSAKCGRAAACTTGQYFDGNACVSGTTYPSPYPTSGGAACSDGRDNDGDGKIDYPADDGCYGSGDYDETYGATTSGCRSYASQSSCQSVTGCVWYPNHWDGTHCDDTAHGQSSGGGTYPDCSKYGAGWHIMDSSGSCFNSEMTQYKTLNGTLYYCSSTPTTGCSGSTYGSPYPSPVSGSCTQELINLLGTGCHNMGNAWFNTEMNRYVLPGTIAVKDCTTAYISSCTTGSTGGTTSDCSTKYGAGWHTMDASGNCFNSEMTQYKTVNGTLYYCSSTPATGCSGGTTTGAACSDGRDNDGDGKIDYPADDGCYSSSDYDETIPSTTTGYCPSSFAHDMGGYCMLTNDLSRCAAYSNASVEANYTTSACTSGTTYPSPSPYPTSTSSSCPSGYHFMPSSNECMSDADSNVCQPVGGGTVRTCVYGSGSPYPSPSTYPSTTSCPSGQYWNGTACVNTSTTDCPSGQYWNGTACVSSTTSPSPTPSPTSTACSTPSNCYDSAVCASSGWYWYNGGCWSYPSPTPTPSPTPEPTPYPSYTPAPTPTSTTGAFLNSRCPSNHYWNGSYCVVRADYTTHFLAKINNSLRDIAGVIGGLFGF